MLILFHSHATMLSSRSLVGVTAAGGSSHTPVPPAFTSKQCRLQLSQINRSSSSNQQQQQQQRQSRRRQQHCVVAAAAKGFGSSKAKVTSSKANSRAAQKCPCGSGQPYQSCCGRYHTGAALAPTPEALLRARFSAYKMQLVDYLVATTHKDNPEHTGDPVTYARSVQRTARGVEYLSLSIVDLPEQQLQQLLQQKAAGSGGGSGSAGAVGDDNGFLRFSVRWRPRSPGVAAIEEVATETSHFKRVNGAWQYFGMLE